MKFHGLRIVAFLGLVCEILILAPPAKADNLPPGAPPTSPDVFPFLGNNFVAFNKFTYSNNTGALSGAGGEVVVIDPNTGDLDFVFQVSNTSSGPIQGDITRITLSNFGAFSTDVGYEFNTCINNGPPADFCNDGLTDVNPDTVDRLTADAVGFNFTTGGGVPSGEQTVVLTIRTNATSFTAGSIGIYDNGVATFEPGIVPAVPEPPAIFMLASGLVSLGLLRRRFIQTQCQGGVRGSF